MKENYLKNIKKLIEEDIVLIKKNRLQEENHRLNTYYNIGKLIVEAQGGSKRAKYGNELIKQWSKELTDFYGKGYDTSNLKRMRQLYLVFRKGGPPGHLSWTHYRYILPIKDENKRNYYINMCIKQNLTKNQLIEKIKLKEYERLEYKEKINLITSENNQLTFKSMLKDPLIIKTNERVYSTTYRIMQEVIK